MYNHRLLDNLLDTEVLVHLLDVGATGTTARRGTATTRHTARHTIHAARHAATTRVHGLHDGGADALNLLLLVLKLLLLSHLVGLQPGQGIVDGLHCLLLV